MNRGGSPELQQETGAMLSKRSTLAILGVWESVVASLQIRKFSNWQNNFNNRHTPKNHLTPQKAKPTLSVKLHLAEISNFLAELMWHEGRGPKDVMPAWPQLRLRRRSCGALQAAAVSNQQGGVAHSNFLRK